MVGKRWAIGLAVFGVLVATAACSDDEAPPASDPSASEDSSPPDAAVLRSYVEALAEGDVDAAMDLRCEEGRHEGASRRQFGAELERLKDALGTPGLVRVVENDPPTDAGAWVEGGDDDPEARWREQFDAVELTYWLAFDGVEIEDPQIVVVLDQDGERRICGHVTHVANRLFDVLDDGVHDTGLRPPGDLSGLMPASIGEDFRQVADDTYAPVDVAGALESHTRAWQQNGVRAGARVTAIRFTSPDAALDWAVGAALDKAGDAAQQFDVPRLDGEVGVRISASAWLLIQPTGTPPFVDQVNFVAGDVGVEVAITLTNEGADTRRVADLVHRVADLARS